MMKQTAVMAISLLANTVFFAALASAQEGPYSCYLRDSSGRTMNLSSLCQGGNAPAAPRVPARSFVADFRSLANRYPSEVQQELNDYVQRNRDSAIAEARTTCRVLKYGGAQAAAVRQRAISSRDASSFSQAKQTITRTLAISHYCPEYAR